MPEEYPETFSVRLLRGWMDRIEVLAEGDERPRRLSRRDVPTHARQRSETPTRNRRSYRGEAAP